MRQLLASACIATRSACHYPISDGSGKYALRDRERAFAANMSAMAAKRQEVVGKDQDGRDVYADKSVVVPGSLRMPDGTLGRTCACAPSSGPTAAGGPSCRRTR